MDYVWTYNLAEMRSGIDGSFPLDYHVPRSKMKVDVGSIVDSRIWLVAREGAQDYLFGFISPSSVQQYESGDYSDDFFLRANPYASVRLLPRSESKASWSVQNMGSEDGIRECSLAEQADFTRTISQNQRVNFSVPTRALLDVIPRTAYRDKERAIPDQLKLVLRTLAFGDIARTRSFPSVLSAMSGVALYVAGNGEDYFKDEEAVKLVMSLDPLPASPNQEIKEPREIAKVAASLKIVVDTFLELLDPDQIQPRAFVARSEILPMHWLEKTQLAEEKHEAILKDTVIFLQTKAYETYKTQSFDLFTKKNGISILWEAKSANSSNFLEQGEKGIVQLLRYATALSEEGNENVRLRLLIENTDQKEGQAYLTKMAKRAGIELLLYDARKDWPDRIFGADMDVSW